MALEFKKVEPPCSIWRWRTKLPRLNYCRESPTFSRSSGQFQFRFDCYFNDNYECFRLNLLSKPISTPKENLPVYVEKNDKNSTACYLGTVTNKGNCVSLTMQSLKKDYGISEDEISFIVIFDVGCERTVEKAVPKQSPPLKSVALQTQSPCLPCLQNFSEDIGKLFGNTDYSDAVLKCGDKSFLINRNILSIRSEVFAAMFRNKLKEGQTGEVDIPNVEPNVMEQFLLYIYSGRAEALSLTTAFSLYQISDMYNVPSLKRNCASFLADSLTEDVVCEVLQLAQHYENKELLDIATSYVTTKAEFIKSTTWKTFAKDYPEIAVEVYMKLH